MMADIGQQEDEYDAADMAAAANTTNAAEPVDADGGKDDIAVTANGEAASLGGSDTNSHGKERSPEFHRMKSYATTTSAVTRTDSHVDTPAAKKPWYKNLNPLRWGRIPPVPETRSVSREYTAPFLSLVYFQWMAPLMSVSCLQRGS